MKKYRIMLMTGAVLTALTLSAGLLVVSEPIAEARPAARSARSAPGGKAAKGRFYDFDDMLIDGEIQKPDTLFTRALKSPSFERLMRLQKSFLDQLGHTVRYPSLRFLR